MNNNDKNVMNTAILKTHFQNLVTKITFYQKKGFQEHDLESLLWNNLRDIKLEGDGTHEFFRRLCLKDI